MRNIKELSKEELALFLEKLGEKPYRTRQVISWLYKQHAASFDEMTNLSKELRKLLRKKAYVSSPLLLEHQVSKDGTMKFLFELDDKETIESVLIPNLHGEGKYTACISSQVGCALGCAFCKTGELGLKRNLRSFEIVDQIITLQRFVKESVNNSDDTGGITNIVLMGMGEPLNNFKEVIKALSTLTSVMDYSKRRITLSTAGIVPKIVEIGENGPEVNLAISLNATTNKVRDEIMPVNKKYPIGKLLDACRSFPLSPGRVITFEYVLLGGLNDSDEDARRLVGLLKGIRAKVNLIPYNASDSKALRVPSDSRVQKFQDILLDAGLRATIRKSSGSDISAACGQLKAGYDSKI